MPKTNQSGAGLKSISSYDMSGGVQNKAVSALSQQNTLLHILNGEIDKKTGGIVGRSGTVEKYSTARAIDNLFIHRVNATRKYLVMANEGAYQNIYLAPNSDFSGSHSAILSGHFVSGTRVEAITFGKKTMLFNGVQAPKQYDGSSFSNITNAPASGEFPDVLNQRLYVFGNDSFLHYSDVINSSGDGFSSDSWQNRGINPNDGQKAMGMKRHRGRLVLFKDNSIYRFDGANEPEPIINVGIQSEKGYAQTDFHVYFHSGTTIREMGLGDPVIISRPVEKYLKAMPQANWSKVSAEADEAQVYFWIGDITINDPLEWDNGKTYSDVVLVYNFLLERWTVYSGLNMRVQFRDTDNGKMYFADENGSIMYRDPSVYSDNGNSIEFSVKWHPIHYGVPHMIKQVDRVFLYATPGVSVRAGRSFDDLSAVGVYDFSLKGSLVRKEVRFNELCISAGESYKETPPFIEQLYIGNGQLLALP